MVKQARSSRFAWHGALTLGLLLAGSGPAAAAAGDADAGRQNSVQCVACHGAFGISDNEAWPDLAGQSAEYLAKQLADFRAGGRHDPWMTQLAVPLSADEIADLAAYYSSLEGLDEPDAASIPAAAAACAACHSARARIINSAWPVLGGQNAAYLAKQLRDFRAGLRQDPVMAPLARALASEDIDRLAALYAGQ